MKGGEKSMYIDTHTKNSMEKSLCNYFGITSDVLYGLFEYAGNEGQGGSRS